MIRRTLLFATLGASLVRAQDPPAEITVSAAISLKKAFEEIGALHEARGGGQVLFNFGASGDLLKQIVGGAPVDVFASAAAPEMDVLDKTGRLLAGTRVDIAGNELVLVVPAEGQAPLIGFVDLARQQIGRVAIGDPRTVPVGRYAQEIFCFFNMPARFQDKLVFGENARQVLDYVARGEVEAGVVYATDAASRSREVRVAATAPADSHKPVVYPIAVLKESPCVAQARAFVALTRSPEGEAVLRKHGFRALN